VRAALVRNDHRERGLLATLERSPLWVPIYYDHLHQLYLRVTPATRELAAKLAIDWNDPPDFDVERPPALDPPDRLASLFPRLDEEPEAERLGVFFAGAGNYPRAQTYLERAHEADPGDVEVRLYLGLIYRALGRQAEADELLARVPRSVLDGADVHLQAGRLWMWVRRPVDAVEELTRAVELGGFHPDYALPLARAAIAAGLLEQAESTLERLIAADRELYEAWNLRAALAIKLGRPDLAESHFRRSLSIHPGQPRVRAMLGEAGNGD